MASIWHKEEEKLINCISKLDIPNSNLDNVQSLRLIEKEDLNQIENTIGVYWILTNAPIVHCFHKENVPEKLKNLTIIYCGFSSKVRDRLVHHLFNDEENSGTSALCANIICNNVKKKDRSWRKKAWNPEKKIKKSNIVTIKGKKMNNKEDLKNLYLNDEELTYVDNHQQIFFEYGIDIHTPKYNHFDWQIYYITGFKSKIYGLSIEEEWKKKYGKPQLCIQ